MLCTPRCFGIWRTNPISYWLHLQTEEDLFSLKSQLATTEDTVNRLTQEVAAQQRAAGDDKLAMFRQQSAIIAKKLAQKEESFEIAVREAETLERELEAKV